MSVRDGVRLFRSAWDRWTSANSRLYILETELEVRNKERDGQIQELRRAEFEMHSLLSDLGVDEHGNKERRIAFFMELHNQLGNPS